MPHNVKASWIKSVHLNLHNLHTQEKLAATPELVATAVKSCIIGGHLAQTVFINLGQPFVKFA